MERSVTKSWPAKLRKAIPTVSQIGVLTKWWRDHRQARPVWPRSQCLCRSSLDSALAWSQGGSHPSVPKVSGEKMSREVGGLDSARLFEQVAGVVEQSEMPTVDVVPVLLTG